MMVQYTEGTVWICDFLFINCYRATIKRGLICANSNCDLHCKEHKNIFTNTFYLHRNSNDTKCSRYYLNFIKQRTHLYNNTWVVFLIISIVRFIYFCITSQTTSAKSMFDLSIYRLRERATIGLDLLGTLIKLFLTWPH